MNKEITNKSRVESPKITIPRVTIFQGPLLIVGTRKPSSYLEVPYKPNNSNVAESQESLNIAVFESYSTLQYLSLKVQVPSTLPRRQAIHCSCNHPRHWGPIKVPRSQHRLLWRTSSAQTEAKTVLLPAASWSVPWNCHFLFENEDMQTLNLLPRN